MPAVVRLSSKPRGLSPRNCLSRSLTRGLADPHSVIGFSSKMHSRLLRNKAVARRTAEGRPGVPSTENRPRSTLRLPVPIWRKPPAPALPKVAQLTDRRRLPFSLSDESKGHKIPR